MRVPFDCNDHLVARILMKVVLLTGLRIGSLPSLISLDIKVRFLVLSLNNNSHSDEPWLLN